MNFTKYILQTAISIATISLCFWTVKPLIGEIYLTQADIYTKQKMYYLAFDLYKKGLGFDSLNAALHQKIALLYIDISFIESNKEYVKKGISELLIAQQLTGDPQVDYRLGLAFERIGSKEKAAYYFKRAYTRSAGNISVNEIALPN